MSADLLNAFFEAHSYLLVDVEKCKGMPASSINDQTHPHLFRWHSHISNLIAPSETAKSETKKEDGQKEGKKQKGKQAGKKEEVEAKSSQPVDEEKARKDKLKKVLKEGGKRGVEIEGAADMGGLQFFCTSVDEPDGDLDMLVESMKAMNEKSNPAEEERKGGSGNIGKVIFSAGAEQLAVVAYVPEAKQAELSCEEWLKHIISTQSGGEVLNIAKDICTARVPTNQEKGIFPLKLKEPMILDANNYLRKKGLFPDNDDDDDDEMVFGDDDFPS